MQGDIVKVHGILVDLSTPKIGDAIKAGLRAGWYEEDEAVAAKKLLRAGDVVLEVGGGCGFLSAFISKLNRASRVISVEADPELIPLMKRTHSLNNVNVETVNEVLSDSFGYTEFYVSNEYWISSRTPAVKKLRHQVSVPTAPLQTRLADWQPSLLIVDIEGGERELFRQPLVPSVDRIVVEVHEDVYGPSGVKDVMDRISDLGFAFLPFASRGQVLSYQRVDRLPSV